MTPVPADPTVVHPVPEQPRVVLLKPMVTSPLIDVGEFSYYDDPDDPTALLAQRRAPEEARPGPSCVTISMACSARPPADNRFR